MEGKETKPIFTCSFLRRSALAGFMIGLAGALFLQCDNKIIGSMLFSLGLIAVILFDGLLYTGKIGYVRNRHEFVQALFILTVNLVIAFLVGFVYRLVNGPSGAILTRLDKSWIKVLVDGFGCGVCIYFAVEGWKKTKSLIPIILGVMAFILGGFEHTVACAMYLGAGEWNWIGFGYVLLIAVGNSLGSLFIRFLQYGFKADPLKQ